MKVEPYARVDGIEFGASRAAVMTALGVPRRESVVREGQVELEYLAAIYRFDNDRLLELTIDTPVISFGPVAVPFQALSSFLSDNDNDVFEVVGFIVSPAYGVAFDPDFPSWVTAFPRESLPEWQSLSSR